MTLTHQSYDSNGVDGTPSVPPLDVDTDVLIVGAGVTGLALAALLATAGVKALTVAKHPGTAPSPRAHLTNQRTMEIFREMGIEDQVHAIGTRLRDLGNGVICTSLTGLEIARYSCYGSSPQQHSDYTRASPSEMTNAPQHVLEKVLLSHAKKMGADIRFSNELLHIEQTAEGVVARMRLRHTKAEYTIRARYAVGADGARSLIGEQTGFNFKGEHGLKHMLTSWFEADLTKFVNYRPALIYIMAKPGNAYWVGSGSLINVKPFTEWTINRQYDPSEGEPDISDEGIIAYTREAIGIYDVPFRIKDTSKWTVNNVVATEYRRGRIFLAGDAAHRHPPASGLGSNTCVQDSYNLAWKLNMVLSGHAGDELLDSYDQERQPVGDQVVSHAIRTVDVYAKVPEVLGFHHGQSPDVGYATLEELFSDAPRAEKRRAELADVIDLQNLRSNALGIQLGQRYKNSNAVVDDGTAFPDIKGDPALNYSPTTHPGGYMPHAWVEMELGHKPISTLDIVGHGQFSLVVGVGGKPYGAAAESVSKEFGIELPVYSIGSHCQFHDMLGQWAAIREITDRGALLIRPDRHIAWRCFHLPSNPTEVLRSALRQVLARGSLDGSSSQGNGRFESSNK